MKRPSIKAVLLSVFVVLGATVMIFAGGSLLGMQRVNDNLTSIAGGWMPSIQSSKEMESTLANIVSAYKDHILSTDKKDKQRADQAIAWGRAHFLKELDNYSALTSDDKALKLLGQIREKFSDFDTHGKELVAASTSNNVEAARLIQFQNMRPLANAIGAKIDFLVEASGKGASDAYDKSKRVFATAFNATISVIAFSAALIIAAMIFAIRSIARPIGRIEGSMRNLAAGDTDAIIPYSGRADEIGKMAASVEVFRHAAIDNRRLAAEAEAQRKFAEDQREKLSQEAEQAAQSRLEIATSGLASGLRRLASGDLSFQLREAFSGEFEPLRADFNSAIEQLCGTLRHVAMAADLIDERTRDISHGTAELSGRTEKQAAQLEETAAVLGEITENVRSASMRSEEILAAATNAEASSESSSGVVSDVIGAMERIERSSRQISGILALMDEVAFQTNLLALNAGVEAARAGDNGKGFAVVAHEVRELAQRSATAARDIKVLLQTSANDVESGVDLVRRAGDALGDISVQVKEVTTHVAAISLATKQQSLSLLEVNGAVKLLDQVTQQNSAMVEEANSAGQKLLNETGKLRQLVMRFKLSPPDPSQHLQIVSNSNETSGQRG